MGVVTRLENGHVEVVPGQLASAQVVVRNTGTQVDRVTPVVLGVAAEFAEVAPAQVSLLPGTEETVTITFRPERSAETPSGSHPLGVRAISEVDPEESALVEGRITIASYLDVFAEVVPRSSRGRRRGKTEVAIDNRGNSPFNAALTAYDVDQLLDLSVTPPGIAIQPGTAAFATVSIKPHKTFWRGTAKSIPFEVSAADEAGASAAAAGTFVQEAILPRWAPRAVLGAIAALVALTLLWFTVLRPTVESAAKNAVEEPLQAVDARLDTVEEATTGTTAPPDETGGDDGGPETEIEALLGGEPYDQRLFVAVGPGGQAPSSTGAVPADQTIAITDIVLGNPRGGFGTLTISRDGAELLVVNLANFRDLDYHFVTPIVIGSGSEMTLTVSCAGDSPVGCEVSALLTGLRGDA